MQIADAQVGVSPTHRKPFVTEQLSDVSERRSCLSQPAGVGVPETVEISWRCDLGDRACGGHAPELIGFRPPGSVFLQEHSV